MKWSARITPAIQGREGVCVARRAVWRRCSLRSNGVSNKVAIVSRIAAISTGWVVLALMKMTDVDNASTASSNCALRQRG